MAQEEALRADGEGPRTRSRARSAGVQLPDALTPPPPARRPKADRTPRKTPAPAPENGSAPPPAPAPAAGGAGGIGAMVGVGNAGASGGKPVASAYSKSEHVHGKFVTIASMLSLLVLCPPFVIFLWFVLTEMKGSLPAFAAFCQAQGLEGVLAAIPRPTALAWQMIGAFAAFEAALQLLIPGKVWIGPVSPAGNRPVYWCNGFACYCITLATFGILTYTGLYNFAAVYDSLGEIFSALIIGSFVFCVFLYVKGNVAPSSDDWGSSGNIIQDFFWGMELYPRIGKYFDIKTFTNCRFGMMSWAVLILCYFAKQHELHGHVADSMLVSGALQLLYITKFFLWEAGYWNTMDIQHDRAGYYICWGCMVWVPCIYTSPAMYLVHHPIALGLPVAFLIGFVGAACVLVNYDSDRQRMHFRATDGKCLIWGRPAAKVEAQYTTEKGEVKTSLLLASGWWGISRHFHYVPEILASFFWTVPGGFHNGLQYFYVVFLTILLMDRAIRDDQRCRKKYGKYWDMYCSLVPAKVIPYVY